MRMLGFFVLFAATACSSGPRLSHSAQGATVVEVRGAALAKGPYDLGIRDLEALPRRSIRGLDPQTGKVAVWEGPSVATIVSDRVDLKKSADTVIVRTADRGAVPVPLTVIRQLKPVLADRMDGVRLATRVVAWPTAEWQGLTTDPRVPSWWARDPVAFEVVDWSRTLGPALATPDGAADAARRGAGVFGDRCIACHRMRGAGGERGPDLTTIASRMRPAAFASLLKDHPGWHAADPADVPGEEAATEVWAFLQAVAASSTATLPQEFTADRGSPLPPGE